MTATQTLSHWMTALQIDLPQLVAASGLDERVVKSIVSNRYTTSPAQREQIAAALGVGVDEIRWSRAVDVDHMYGHGPQFGRSP